MSHAAPPAARERADVELVETPIYGVGSVLLPAGWHYNQTEYSSRYGNQAYRTIRASVDRNDEDAGLLSIDVSPSHPRLWRKPLTDHVESRIKALNTHGPTTIQATDTPDLPYEAVQRTVLVGSDLRTVFRVFRQKSRVITVAYTASASRFVPQLARRLIHAASDSLRLELPILEVVPPKLGETEMADVGGALSIAIPAGWELRTHRIEPSTVPTETLELVPPELDSSDDPPTLTFAIVHVSALGPDVQIEGLGTATTTTVSSGQSRARPEGPRATVFEVDHDTLAAARVLQIGNDVLTITYAAPDYLFEVKPALELLRRASDSAVLHER